MSKTKNLAVALTIAGSDSGGGAGIQADLKTFAAVGVHGTSVITCITAQNPSGIKGIQSCSPEMVKRQITAVFEGFQPTAVKTGMLYSAPIIREVIRCLKHSPDVPLVVDPVMVATSGSALLKPAAIKILKADLLPRATLVTPNLREAEVLLGGRVDSINEMRDAAHELRRLFGCAALVKGGHLTGIRQAVDIFFDGKTELLLSAPFIKGLHLHGAGCTYSAAITAWLARGHDLPTSVSRAKQHITHAITHAQKAAHHDLLNNF